MKTLRIQTILAASLLLPLLAGCQVVKSGLAPEPPPPEPPRDFQAEAALMDHPRLLLAHVPPEAGSYRVRQNVVHYVRGGTMITTWARSREMVSDLIRKTGGIAGLNGTFFSDARVAGRGNKMIGPVLTADDGEYAPMDPSDAPRCTGRPLVILGASEIAIVPYADWMGDTPEALRRLVPDARDAFLAGGWLVRNGVPATREEIETLCVKDAQDFRRRAFMGVDHQGRLVLGASDFSIDSARLAASLGELDMREAVLLDSGFSTSLVWKDKILVSGHSRRSMPSRPVPHALVILPPAEDALAAAPDLPEDAS